MLFYSPCRGRVSPMNILSIAAECAPYAKMGGLADVVSSLAKEWQSSGHTVSVVLPKYRSISENLHG
ncbi:MAG: glycogen/starch synthase, partial [Candidatus Kapaibacterium sp.]